MQSEETKGRSLAKTSKYKTNSGFCSMITLHKCLDGYKARRGIQEFSIKLNHIFEKKNGGQTKKLNKHHLSINVFLQE